MTTKTLLDGAGASFSGEFNLLLGRQSAANTRSFNLSTEDNAALTAIGAQLPATLGTKTAANSLAVTLASDGPFVTSIGAPSDAAWTTGNGTQIALLKTIAGAAASTAPSPVIGPGGYKAVAASTANAQCGATGAIGDFLSHVTIIPATTSPGSVTIQDGAGSAITIFAGGASSVSNLVSFAVPLGMKATGAGWKINTGANVSVIAVGSFT